MLADGFTTRRGRRGALLHRDAVNGVLRGRRGARLTALTSGGTIPDTADYQVLLEPENHVVGTVNEDFAVESIAGDIFQLGNTQLPHPARRARRGAGRGRAWRAADHPVLAGRGAGAQRRAVGRGVAPARRIVASRHQAGPQRPATVRGWLGRHRGRAPGRRAAGRVSRRRPGGARRACRRRRRSCSSASSTRPAACSS